MKENLKLALIYSVLNACMLSSMTLFAKLLGQYNDAIEITFFRNLSSLAILLLILFFIGQIRSIYKTKRPWAHLLRSSIGTVGIAVGMWSFLLSPLSVATLLFFTSPLFVALLSYPVLGEKVGPYRLASVFIGFIGVALVSAPAFMENSGDITVLGVCIGITYGFIAGCVDLCLRWIGDTEKSSTTTFYFLLFGVVSTAFYWPFSDNSIIDQDMNSMLIILGLGLTGVISLLAKSQSYRLAEAAYIAPITFTMIIWAGLFDYFIWNKLPSTLLLTGGTIIIASNLFILWREHVKNKKSVIEVC